MNLGFETEKIEFKKSTSELKAGLISLSSMLNKHHAGTLYFGVKDNGDICGQDIGKLIYKGEKDECLERIKIYNNK